MPDTAGVIARPPVIYLCSIFAGWCLHRLWPIVFFSQGLGPALALGVGFVLIAVVLFVSAVMQFRKAGTPIPTSQPTMALVTTGPYRFTRNPIYLSFTLFQLGLALWANSLWLLVTLVPAVLLIRYGVIAREERCLVRKLGEPYVKYTQSVRRWV